MNNKNRIVVICVKWGSRYSADDVNILASATRNHLEYEHDFVCVTDDPEGLAESIIVRPLNLQQLLERGMHTGGCWPKLIAYSDEISGAYDYALFLDLDIAVVGQLAPLVDCVKNEDALYLMAKRPAFGWRFLPKRFHPDKLGNSSVVAFRPKSQRHLFHDFKHPIGGNDQNYVSKFAKNSRRFPLAWCPSFKFYGHYFPICLFLNGYERALRDRSAIIIVFHGEPKMRELADAGLRFWGKPKRFSYGPVKWIKAYLEQYGSLQSVTRIATSAAPEEMDVEDMAPAALP